MDTDKIIENDTVTETDSSPKAPFPWKKVLLAPLNACWCVLLFFSKVVWFIIKIIWRIVRFVLKTVWWFVKLGLFIFLVFLGIIVFILPIIGSMSDLGGKKDYETTRQYRERKSTESKQYKSAAGRVFGAAGKVWKSLWGGSRSVETEEEEE